MSDIEIRQLSPANLAEMRGMLTMFGEAFAEPESYQHNQPDDAYLTKLLGREHFIALAAIRDGVVIGGIAAYELEKFEQRRSEIYIYDLAVLAAYRRQGVARALIEYVKLEARRRGAYVIFVQADRDDPPAVSLYAKLGAAEEVLHFDIAPAHVHNEGSGSKEK